MVKKYSKEELIDGVLDFIKDSVSQEAFSEIVSAFIKSAKDEDEANTAYIFTTVKLTDLEEKAIKKKLEEMFNRQIKLEEIVDKSLLAGFKIKLGDWVYDATITGQLTSFEKELYAIS